MILLTKDQLKLAHPLFEHSKDTLILSVFQGGTGSVWLDQLDKPKSARLLNGDFLFFMGSANKKMVENRQGLDEKDGYLMVPQSPEWEEIIEATYPDKHSRFMRYAIHKKGPFDQALLKAYVAQLEDGYELKAFDQAIYEQLNEADWSRDLRGQFTSYEDFQKGGLGFVILKGQEIVSGAGTYSLFEQGIEIEIDTHPDYRRQGLALICGARLILACLESNLKPGWDAASLASVDLAKKFGYELDHPYVTYYVDMT